MVYNQEHMLLAWEGSFRDTSSHSGNVIETFQGSLRFAGPGLQASDNLNTLGSLALVLSRYWGQTTAFMPGNTFIEAVKWNRIDVNGHYADQSNTRQLTPDPVGGAGSVIYPTQVALATTWTTDARRGKAWAGRTFWPTATPIDPSTLGIGAAGALARSKVDATLIKRLNYAARSAYVANPPTGSSVPPWLVAIGWTPGPTADGSGMSASVMSKLGQGTTRVITGAAVGARMDIQRRRGKDVDDRRQLTLTTNAPD